MPELVPVRVRDCACPDTPHALTGDLVYLLPTLSLAGGIAAQQDLTASKGDVNALIRAWLVTFVRYGAVAADFLDPFDVEELLTDFTLASPVAEAANDLYSEAVLRPLGLAPSSSSPTGPTASSTSRTRKSSRSSPVSSSA